MVDQMAFRVTNRRTGGSLGDKVRKALSLRARTIGLLGRSSLGEGEGLWIEPCSSIHMFFMRFTIDAVFVDRSGIVTRVIQGLRPWRIAFGGQGAHAVLELPTGTITASATRERDVLEVSPTARP
jgi:uncharacterized membrane protein (UPF0127 family)